MLTPADTNALLLTLRLALVTTGILLLIGTPLAWFMARSASRFRAVLEAVVALPLVLPPTVLGFYLLLVLGPRGPLGTLFAEPSLAFTFPGLVIGSVIYSLPFVVQPVQNAFRAAGRAPLDTAATLGAGPLDRFFTVALPLARPGFVTASVLGFAHTVGEFGVVLMIGGNIPGVTRVASIAVYDHVETLNYASAHALSLVLVAASLLMLIVVYAYNHQHDQQAAGAGTARVLP